MSRNAYTPGRRSLRLTGYDYSTEGSYFVTICIRNRECILGDVIDGEMIPSPIGDIINHCWLELVDDFANLSLDVYQVMPNHFHGIVVLWENRRMDLINQIHTVPTGLNESRFGPVEGWQQMKNPKKTLGKIIRHFKAKATKKIHDAGFGGFQWQSRFHDRIIRSDDELDRIRNYIRNNPMHWDGGGENPDVSQHESKGRRGTPGKAVKSEE